MNLSNILIGVDVNNSNTQLIKLSFLFGQYFDTKIHFVHIYKPDHKFIDKSNEEIYAIHLKQLEAQVQSWSEVYDDVNYTCIVKSGFPDEVILNIVEEISADLLLLGMSSQESLIYPKSMSMHILNSIDIPMLIVPQVFRLVDFDTIVFNVEFDFEEIGPLTEMVTFAKNFDATITCVHFAKHSNVKKLTKNVDVYKNLFPYQFETGDLDMMIEGDSKTIEGIVEDIEADLLVLLRERKTWKSTYIGESKQEHLIRSINIPTLIFPN